ncbi:MAG: hypothetical protein K6F32_00825 [Bacilli bacterium]|nr:hypothetical protein [Bacilli bacterium]
MKRKMLAMLTGALLVSAVAIGVAGISANFDNPVRNVGATEITTTITSDMLAATALETHAWTFHDQTKAGEGKFRIALDGGKYIDGAILYQDCNHQTLSSNLGGTFSLDNSGQSSANNLNFHFFFSVFGLKNVQTTFKYSITTGAGQDCTFRTKFFTQSSIEDYFSNRDYSGCVSDSSGQAFSSSYLFKLYSAENSYSHESDYSESSKANIFAIQFHSNSVPSGAKASFALTQLELTYTC